MYEELEVREGEAEGAVGGSTGSAVTNEVLLAGNQNYSPITVFAWGREANVPETDVSWGTENDTLMKALEIPEHQKKRCIWVEGKLNRNCFCA